MVTLNVLESKRCIREGKSFNLYVKPEVLEKGVHICQNLRLY